MAYPKNRAGYANLCRLLTLGKRRAAKGKCELSLSDVLEWGVDCVLVIDGSKQLAVTITQLKMHFSTDVFLGLAPQYDGYDAGYFQKLADIAVRHDIPITALGHPIMHHGSRRRLADILSCIREKRTIDTLGHFAQPNAERRLKSEFEMRRLFKAFPEAISNTVDIMDRAAFSLDELKYEYPCLLYTSPSPRDQRGSRMPSSA